MLSGTAASPIEAQQASDIAARLAGGPDKVVNSIAVRGRDQVMLKVTVAEVARNIVKQLGIDLTGQPELRHGGRELQQRQPVHRLRPSAGPDQRPRPASFGSDSVGDGDAPRHGKRRRGADAGRAQPDRDLRRVRDLHRRRRVSGSDRLHLRPRQRARLQPPRSVQEVRHLAQLYAGRADRRPHQPAGDDRSIRTVERQLDHAVQAVSRDGNR